MKTLKLLSVLFIIVAITYSCEKEGPAGPAGTNGTNGNANVTVYGFGEYTFTTAIPWTQFTLPISQRMVDSSLILPYYHMTNYWYQIGEIGIGGSFTSRYFIEPFASSSDLRVEIRNIDGAPYNGADVTWDSIRVFVVPANTFRSAQSDNIDFNNHNEVAQYFEKSR